MLRPQDLAVLRDILRRYASVRQARVFGLRATGAAGRTSDVDLAITAPDMSSSAWHDFCEALECAPIIDELDIVREEDVVEERLREAMQRDEVVMYQSGDGESRTEP